MNAKEALEIRFGCDDLSDDVTVKQYLGHLLSALWSQAEGFSGKRPFGNSGWEWDVYQAFVEAGAIKGEFDEDGCLEDCDEEAAHLLIQACIAELCGIE